MLQGVTFMGSDSRPRNAIVSRSCISQAARMRPHECMPHAIVWLLLLFRPFAHHSLLLRMQAVSLTSCNRCCWWREILSELQQLSSWRGGLRGAGLRWQPRPAQSSGRMLSCTAPSTGCACLLECIPSALQGTITQPTGARRCGIVALLPGFWQEML